ncbi:MAG: hypothetical protein EA388_16175 [Nitriliruptor sp.]|nr:MAG: hypothetical protein EA388_16175 [Nitriliruptor sp.]
MVLERDQRIEQGRDVAVDAPRGGHGRTEQRHLIQHRQVDRIRGDGRTSSAATLPVGSVVGNTVVGAVVDGEHDALSHRAVTSGCPICDLWRTRADGVPDRWRADPGPGWPVRPHPCGPPGLRCGDR